LVVCPFRAERGRDSAVVADGRVWEFIICVLRVVAVVFPLFSQVIGFSVVKSNSIALRERTPKKRE